ncbi:condensation domain-containing protein [Streptomyces sp. NPDC058372]|uniref:condensation domain-containing protein n=1 Tax=Streptomyces sp. NPDC058372 TaxID=3346464 RepID=UPI003667AAE7
MRATVPLTSTLRRVWRRHHEHGAPGVYNVAHRVDLHPDDLRQALADLVARHDALRARAVRRDGELLLEVLAEVPVELPVSDLSAHAGDETARARWCQEQASRPFALDRAPLFRFRLARLGPDHWTLVTVLHHAVCDGWSLGIFRHEPQELYNARRLGTEAQLGPPLSQFTDFARAEQDFGAGRRAELERFWRTELDGVPLTLDLPHDRPRPPVLSGRGALRTWTLDAALTERIDQAAGHLGSTRYAVLTAAFATWAARRQGRNTDLVLATSSANRLHLERAGLVGMVGDSVLLRARLTEADTFADLVGHLGTALFAALDHQELPLTEVTELVSPASPTTSSPTSCSPWSPPLPRCWTCTACRPRSTTCPSPAPPATSCTSPWPPGTAPSRSPSNTRRTCSRRRPWTGGARSSWRCWGR